MKRPAPLKKLCPKKAGALQHLNIRHDAFVEEYIKNGGNGTRAYLKVYSRPDNEITYETAGVNATKLLKDTRVRMAIEARMQDMITPEWIEQEIQKDIINGDKSQRTAALALLARIRSMVSEKRVNVIEQRKEFGEITLDSYAEGATKDKPIDVA